MGRQLPQPLGSAARSFRPSRRKQEKGTRHQTRKGEESMTHDIASVARPPIKFERRYETSVEDLWDLWTTKEGFESWWGPQGFRVEVHAIDPRIGGELFYDMIADGAKEIEYMK